MLIQFVCSISCGKPGCRRTARRKMTSNGIFTPTIETQEEAKNIATAHFRGNGWKIGSTYTCPKCVKKEGTTR